MKRDYSTPVVVYSGGTIGGRDDDSPRAEEHSETSPVRH